MKKFIAVVLTVITVTAFAVAADAAFDHKVVRGDTMWKLSRRYGITLDSMIEANPQVEDPDLIYPDDILHIPVYDDPAEVHPTDLTVSEFENEVVRLTNEYRAKYGLAPLTADPELCRVARIKSQDMVDNRYFSHTSPVYGSPFSMMKAFGVKYRTAGENIACGQRTPSEVVNAWMNSQGHRANILNASFTKIGVGYVSSGNYWTQMFIG
ncbi:MAG: LysM peptidoglycan-binding domain-containing protein [Clostridia bacterium]|nr:LysM peptidoglycan-binding domain-containing protein [Clostridia bacterium]